MLVPLTLLFDRALLPNAARWLGMGWVPTMRVCLDCVVLAAAGSAIGRLQRWMPSTTPHHKRTSLAGVLAFAATLSFSDLDGLIGLNVPWLMQLGGDAVHDSLYLNSFAATAAQHLLLFGCLAAGVLLSRPPRPPLSIPLR